MSTSNTLAVIPARFNSTRFPGKPLVEIAGKTMIQRVFEQAQKYKGFDRVLIATDDERILSHAQTFTSDVLMTSPHHPSGTDRCAEVVQLLEQAGNGTLPDIVINVQGDEPFIHPRQLGLLHHCFDQEDTQIATLAKKIEKPSVLWDPHVVKVVMSQKSHQYNALYFSRHPIPYCREPNPADCPKKHPYYKHIGLYGYRTDILKQISTLKPSALEQAESLEQLRWLENGFSIRVALTERESLSIDTPEDLAKLPRF